MTLSAHTRASVTVTPSDCCEPTELRSPGRGLRIRERLLTGVSGGISGRAYGCERSRLDVREALCRCTNGLLSPESCPEDEGTSGVVRPLSCPFPLSDALDILAEEDHDKDDKDVRGMFCGSSELFESETLPANGLHSDSNLFPVSEAAFECVSSSFQNICLFQ